jgi:hypothetical protein
MRNTYNKWNLSVRRYTMVVWFIPIIIYFLLVVSIYCVWKWLHTKRMTYFGDVDRRLENYLFLFQKAIVTYDWSIYRSDKAYPVLTGPIIWWFNEKNHTLETIDSYLPTLKKERKYLQALVKEDIGINPLDWYRIKKRARATQSLENMLRYLLALATLWIWVIWSLR